MVFFILVKWSSNPERIFTAGLEGEIHAYKIEPQLKDVGKNDEMIHTGDIMDLLPIESMGYLASCGMDKKIVLWDINTLRFNKLFTNGH